MRGITLLFLKYYTFFCLICIASVSCSKYLSPNGSTCVMLNGGIAGTMVILDNRVILSFDSLYTNEEGVYVDGFSLHIYNDNGVTIYKSYNNKLTEEMKDRFLMDSHILKLEFTDFKISGKNHKIRLKNSFFRNKKIEIFNTYCTSCYK